MTVSVVHRREINLEQESCTCTGFTTEVSVYRTALVGVQRVRIDDDSVLCPHTTNELVRSRDLLNVRVSLQNSV